MLDEKSRVLFKILGWRSFQGIFVSLFVGVICFLAVKSLGDDMAYRIAGGRYGYDLVDTEAAQAVAKELGLDQSVWLQMYYWLKNTLSFDFGYSLVSGAKVATELRHTLGYSLQLAAASIVVSILIAIPLGVIAAKRPNLWFDRSLLLFSVVIKSVPSFVLGILLMVIMAVNMQWLPAAGHGQWYHFVLPTLTLSLGLAAVSVQIVRDSALGIRQSSYYHFSRVKGLTDKISFHRHGWRNLLIPVIAYLGMQFVVLVEGVVVVETLFAWPGIGHALVHAIFSRDIPVVQGAAVSMGLIFVSMNALVDIIVLYLDPRGMDNHK